MPQRMWILSRISDQDIPRLQELLQALPLRMNPKKQWYHATSDLNVASPPNALDHDSSASEGLAVQVQSFSEVFGISDCCASLFYSVAVSLFY